MHIEELLKEYDERYSPTTKQDRRSVSFGGTKPKANSGYWRTSAPIPTAPIPDIVIPSYLM